MFALQSTAQMMKRLGLLTSAFVGLLAAASCTDETLGPAEAAGYYRLVSVDGQAIPASINFRIVHSGDLILRDNGTAQFGIRGNFSFFGVPYFSGPYTLNNGQISFTRDTFRVASGTVRGDTLTFSVDWAWQLSPINAFTSHTVTFVRTRADAVPVKSGTYVLTSIGVTPVDGVPSKEYKMLYDSLKFSDGAFYLRSYRAMAFGNHPDTISGAFGITERYIGTYRGTPSSIVLFRLNDSTITRSPPNVDSLFMRDGSLIRRSWNATGVVDWRYEKR